MTADRPSPFPLSVASRGLVGTSVHNWMQRVEPTPREVISPTSLQRLVDNANADVWMGVA